MLGSGKSGEGSREGQVSRGTGLIQVIRIIRPEKPDPLLDQVFAMVERHIGVGCVSDCEVLRAEHFQAWVQGWSIRPVRPPLRCGWP
ncbi:transcriptional regulator [Maliponia aquimaris]|uniref:transcriptional regulator n=1 Tax=Maliponia aquimaris TaxID=1673631 RepID=UPI003522C8AB